MLFTRGMRDKLNNHIDCGREFTVEMTTVGNSVYDFCCFGVDGSEKLSDDRYMVFYNQTSSPNQEIRLTPVNDGASFTINLSALPPTIKKLVFTTNIDGNGIMQEISRHMFTLKQDNAPKIEISMSGTDFKSEKAIISAEIYLKDVWRLAAVANGFNGGLSALLAHFGGVEATGAPAPQPIPQPNQAVPNQAMQSGYAAQQPNPYPQPNAPIPSAPASNGYAAPKAAFQPNPAMPGPAMQSGYAASQPTVEQKKEKISLKKGQKVNLTKNNTSAPIIIENGWSAKGKDYDLKALVRYRDGRLIYVGAANSDEVLSTPEGAVRHGGDVKHPGELEHIDITWHPDIASVAVSSYSAIENGTGSFYRYGVYVKIKNGNQIIEIPAEDTSANDKSYTLCFGEIVFGITPNDFEVSALEMYSRPGSERRIGYKGFTVMMDIGPEGKKK